MCPDKFPLKLILQNIEFRWLLVVKNLLTRLSQNCIFVVVPLLH
jgi:hypothetical protein